MEFDFNKKLTKGRKTDFANLMKQLSNKIGFKVSSRGWGYIMEQAGYINKDQFDKVANAINDCRKEGFLPKVAKKLVTEIIEKYLGKDSLDRFEAKRQEIDAKYEIILDDLEIRQPIMKVIKIVEDSEE
jgi:hypothetical protein